MDSPSLLEASKIAIIDGFEALHFSESTENEGLSPLECLPQELLLKIIELAPEAAFELRLTSHQLCSLVDEAARMKATAPIVEKLKIFVSSREPAQFAPDISFYVPKCNTKLFELRLRVHNFPAEMRAMITLCGRNTDSARHLVYRLKFSALVQEETMIDCLRGCIGTRIEKAMLYGCDDLPAIQTVTRLLEDVHFLQLNIWLGTLTDDVNNLILKSTLMNNVDELAISVGDMEIAHPVQTLRHLSTVVPSLHIEQNSVRDIDPRREYFFGVYHADWASIIIEMFAGKLNKLYIENYFYTGYLSSRSADLLRERLPSLGKNIWFSASCSKSYANGLCYIRNEHSVKACRDNHVVRRPGTPRPHSLRVKHLSRENEKFETFYPFVSAFHSMQ